jgi:hypothetical protein
VHAKQGYQSDAWKIESPFKFDINFKKKIISTLNEVNTFVTGTGVHASS